MQGQHTLGYEELPSLSKNTVLDPEKLTYYTDYFVGYLQTFNRKKVSSTLQELEVYLYEVDNQITEVKLFLTDLYLRIKEKINLIYNTLNIPFPTNSTVIDFIEKKHYLYEIILFLSEQFEMIMNASGSPSRTSVLDDIIYYIENNYQNNIRLESIAPLFGYNSAYLGKIFNKTVGESFNSYVDHTRIEHSKELLLSGNYKVYEIAEKVGYRNVDYFHKKFRRYVGESPAEFRKKAEQSEWNITEKKKRLYSIASFSILLKQYIANPLTVKNRQAGPIKIPKNRVVVLKRKNTTSTANTPVIKMVLKKNFVVIFAEFFKVCKSVFSYRALKGKA